MFNHPYAMYYAKEQAKLKKQIYNRRCHALFNPQQSIDELSKYLRTKAGDPDEIFCRFIADGKPTLEYTRRKSFITEIINILDSNTDIEDKANQVVKYLVDNETTVEKFRGTLLLLGTFVYGPLSFSAKMAAE